MQLFPRSWSLSLGNRDVSDLDLAFQVERKTRGAAGVAEIRVWNGAPETISAATRGAQIRLSAGYEGGAPLIFSGTVRSATVSREGPDRILTILGRDGGGAFFDAARLSRAYAPGTPVSTVVRDAARALQVGEGNLPDVLSSLRLRGGAATFESGYAVDGLAARTLTALLSGAGYRWSVQHGALLVLRRGGAQSVTGELLTPDTGLIESPTWDARRRVLTARALIRPGLEPGRRVQIESEAASGGFEVRGVTWIGDTRGEDWTAEMTLRAL